MKQTDHRFRNIIIGLLLTYTMVILLESAYTRSQQPDDPGEASLIAPEKTLYNLIFGSDAE